VGGDLTVYAANGHCIPALYVAIGELGVLLTLGWLLYALLRRRGIARRLFG